MSDEETLDSNETRSVDSASTIGSLRSRGLCHKHADTTHRTAATHLELPLPMSWK